MSTKIVITEDVWPFQGRTIAVALSAKGVEFNVDPEEYENHSLPWDKVTDVPFLAQEFRGLRVYEFEALCKALYHASTLRDQLPPETEPTPRDFIEAGAAYPGMIDFHDTPADARMEAYKARAAVRLARMDELAPLCAFEKMPGTRTPEEQAACDEHERLLAEQLQDEREQGL